MNKRLSVFFLLGIFSMAFAREKNIKNHVTETRLGGFDEIELVTSSLNIKKFANNKLNQEEYTVLLVPRKGTVALKYKRLGLKEKLTLDADARVSLSESYRSYLSDYEEKKLDRSKKKFEAKYSKARVRMDWGAFTYNSNVETIAEYGYMFVGKSPYFAIHIKSAKSEESKSDITPEYSGSILFFTRSQLKTLVESISEENISNTLSNLTNESLNEDDYEEAEY